MESQIRSKSTLHNIRRNIPKGWGWAKLEEISGFVKGKKPKNLGIQNESLTIPYINIEAFEHKVFNQYTDGNSCSFCERDDILIVWDGARCGLVGRGVFGAIGSTLAKLESQKLNRSYLFYFLQLQYEYINKRPRGVGIPHVEPDIFWKISVPIPPFPEQHRIVSKIEELFTKLDAGVENLKKIKKEIKRYRQAVLKHAFEGKLTEKWRKANKDKLEPVSELLKRIKEEMSLRGAKRRSKLKNNKDEIVSATPHNDSLPELPEGWEWIRIVEIAEKINPGFPSGQHNKMNIGVPHLRPMNIDEKGNVDLSVVKYVEQKINYDLLKKWDVLFNNTNSPEWVGNTTYIKENKNWFYSNHMTRIRLFNLFVYAPFISYNLYSIFLSGYFKTNCTHHVNQASINSTCLGEKVLLSLAPLREQQKIVEEIERLFSVADEVEKIVEKSLKESERLRQSILKIAFEGRLVPQDPNDEPAEKLLERIKAEKEKMEAEKKRKTTGFPIKSGMTKRQKKKR